MKKSRFTAEQIGAILQEVAPGSPGRQAPQLHDEEQHDLSLTRLSA